MQIFPDGVTKNKKGLVIDAENSKKLPISNSTLVAFAALIDRESSGKEDESYAIGNAAMNYITNGGSKKDLKNLADIVFYKNSFARGATQKNYTSFIKKSKKQQNAKFALGAAINSVAYTAGWEGFTDITNGATGWDGVDLVQSDWSNHHRNYIWSSDSKSLLEFYQVKYGSGINVDDWKYSSKSFEDKATAIIGATLYQQVQGSRTERKTGNKNRFK